MSDFWLTFGGRWHIYFWGLFVAMALLLGSTLMVGGLLLVAYRGPLAGASGALPALPQPTKPYHWPAMSWGEALKL